MNPTWIVAAGLYLLAALATLTAQENVRLTLPPEIYAVPGVEMNVYFANTVLVEREKDGNLAYAVECAVGTADASRWTLNAAPAQVGSHPFKLTVKDAAGKVLGSAKSNVVISPAEAGNGRKVNLLVGDSLTHATIYPNELARLLSQPGNPRWKMLGTHQPGNATEGVRHEGYGGWTWNRFRTLYKPDVPPIEADAPPAPSCTPTGWTWPATSGKWAQCRTSSRSCSVSMTASAPIRTIPLRPSKASLRKRNACWPKSAEPLPTRRSGSA